MLVIKTEHVYLNNKDAVKRVVEIKHDTTYTSNRSLSSDVVITYNGILLKDIDDTYLVVKDQMYDYAYLKNVIQLLRQKLKEKVYMIKVE
jgi:hypothetical protein